MPRPNISGGGRKSKGERELLATRAHPVLAAQVRANAEEQGLTVSDYLAVVLADALGLRQYAPVVTNQHQDLLLSA
jgi:hypothetical protein